MASLEKNRAAVKKWRLAHPEQNRERKARYPEQDRLRASRWYAENKERVRLYHLANPDIGRNSNEARRARKADAFIEAVDRQVVFARDAGLCGICQQGVEPANWHLDHIQPLSKGGQHSYDNVQVSHPVCNMRKHIHW